MGGNVTVNYQDFGIKKWQWNQLSEETKKYIQSSPNSAFAVAQQLKKFEIDTINNYYNNLAVQGLSVEKSDVNLDGLPPEIRARIELRQQYDSNPELLEKDIADVVFANEKAAIKTSLLNGMKSNDGRIMIKDNYMREFATPAETQKFQENLFKRMNELIENPERAKALYNEHFPPERGTEEDDIRNRVDINPEQIAILARRMALDDTVILNSTTQDAILDKIATSMIVNRDDNKITNITKKYETKISELDSVKKARTEYNVAAQKVNEEIQKLIQQQKDEIAALPEVIALNEKYKPLMEEAKNNKDFNKLSQLGQQYNEEFSKLDSVKALNEQYKPLIEAKREELRSLEATRDNIINNDPQVKKLRAKRDKEISEIQEDHADMIAKNREKLIDYMAKAQIARTTAEERVKARVIHFRKDDCWKEDDNNVALPKKLQKDVKKNPTLYADPITQDDINALPEAEKHNVFKADDGKLYLFKSDRTKDYIVSISNENQVNQDGEVDEYANADYYTSLANRDRATNQQKRIDYENELMKNEPEYANPATRQRFLEKHPDIAQKLETLRVNSRQKDRRLAGAWADVVGLDKEKDKTGLMRTWHVLKSGLKGAAAGFAAGCIAEAYACMPVVNGKYAELVQFSTTVAFHGVKSYSKQVTVSGDVPYSQTVTVEGSVNYSDVIIVEGDESYHTSVTVEGYTPYEGEADWNASGTVTVDTEHWENGMLVDTNEIEKGWSASGSTPYSGEAYYSQTVDVDGTVHFRREVPVEGQVYYKQTVDVNGQVHFEKTVYVEGEVEFDETKEVHEEKEVSGQTSAHHKFDINAPLKAGLIGGITGLISGLFTMGKIKDYGGSPEVAARLKVAERTIPPSGNEDDASVEEDPPVPDAAPAVTTTPPNTQVQDSFTAGIEEDKDPDTQPVEFNIGVRKTGRQIRDKNGVLQDEYEAHLWPSLYAAYHIDKKDQKAFRQAYIRDVLHGKAYFTGKTQRIEPTFNFNGRVIPFDKAAFDATPKDRYYMKAGVSSTNVSANSTPGQKKYSGTATYTLANGTKGIIKTTKTYTNPTDARNDLKTQIRDSNLTPAQKNEAFRTIEAAEIKPKSR